MEKQLNEINIDKITSTQREALSSVWFTADYHHGHPAIIKHANRPIEIENHDEWIIEEVHNKYIQKKDRVYMLGDISMAHTDEARKFLSKIKGQKWLILGNHDGSIQNAPHWMKVTQMLDLKFKQEGLNLGIFLCHYPMISWNRSYHGNWHLYGHVHGRVKHTYLGLDVGIDNDEISAYRPINMIEIIEWMQKRKEEIGDNKLRN